MRKFRHFCGDFRPFYTTLLTIAFLFSFQLTQAQYLEAGTYIGTTTFVGDLSEQRFDGDFKSALGIFARYNFSQNLAAKASFTKGTITGNDQDARFENIRMRNLSFRSEILELAVTGEFNLVPFHIRADKKASPYFFTGIAAYYFNPQAEWEGEWYNLQPLATEGKDYNRLQVAVPFGLGFKFNLNYRLNFGFEFGARKTFTDYLDDVSTSYPDIAALQSTNSIAALLSYRTPEYMGGVVTENPVGQTRGDATNKDWYFFIGATVSVNLTDKYGLDFDEKYEVFKEHLKKTPRSEQPEVIKRRKKRAYLKKQRELKRKKKQLKMPAKKRSRKQTEDKKEAPEKEESDESKEENN